MSAARLFRIVSALGLACDCAARRPEPVARTVWTDPPPLAPSVPSPSAPAPEAGSTAPAALAAPRPRPTVPLLPTLAPDNLRFREVHECPRGTCVHPRSPFAPTTIAVDDGASTLPPVNVWVQWIRPGASVHVPSDPSLDLLGVTLVGTARLEGSPPSEGTPLRAPPWTAFRFSNAGAVLRSADGRPVAVLLATAHTLDAAPGAPSAREVPAGAHVVTRDLSTVETLSWADGAMHARIAFDAGDSPRASLELLFASDDAPVAEHAHPGTWEALVVFSAAGHLHLPTQRVGDRALSERNRTVTQGAIVYVPADVRHAWMPDGTHPLVAVQFYAPAGPEARFRTLAASSSASTPPPPVSVAP